MRVASSLSGHGSFTAGWCGSVVAFATEAHAPIPRTKRVTDFGANMAAAPATVHRPTPRVAADLTTSQLRYLILARLPPTVAVEAWGVDRAALLALAEANGLTRLSAADVEEVGPATTSHAGKDARREMERRLALSRSSRHRSQNWKFPLQMVVVLLLCMVKSSSLKQWLGLSPPPLPVCPKPQWWHTPLPWMRPGAKGECAVLRKK